MEIRIAKRTDIPELRRLLLQVGGVHHDIRPDIFRNGCLKYTDQELAELLLDETRPVWAAMEGDTMLGYCFCIFQQHLNNNILTDIRTLYIDDLCVDENCRGQHIGSKLYAYVLDFARQSGCYNVTLNVWSCNKSALAFYEKLGLKSQKVGMETIL